LLIGVLGPAAWPLLGSHIRQDDDPRSPTPLRQINSFPTRGLSGFGFSQTPNWVGVEARRGELVGVLRPLYPTRGEPVTEKV
jgi:hypothetical protein